MLETWLSEKCLPAVAAQGLGWQAEQHRIVVEWPSANSSRVIHRFHPERPNIQDWSHRENALPYGINTVMVQRALEVVVVFTEFDYLALSLSGVPAIVYPGHWNHDWFDASPNRKTLYFWVYDSTSCNILSRIAQSIGARVTYGAINALPARYTPTQLVLKHGGIDEARLATYVESHKRTLFYTNDFDKAIRKLRSLKVPIHIAYNRADETYIVACPFHHQKPNTPPKAVLTRTAYHCPSCGSRGSTTEYFAYHQIIVPTTPIERHVAVVRTVRLTEVTPKKLRWLWHGRLPLGKISILTGKPQIGKSLVSLDIAARLSTGQPLPGTGSPSARCTVVLMTAEDDVEDTVVPRLQAAGADLSNILLVSDIGGRWPVLGDVNAIAKMMERNRAKLLIVDPLTAYLGATDAYSDAQVRGYLAPLAEAARDIDFSVLLIRHPRKSAVEDELMAGGGSIAFSALARSELHATADERKDSFQVRRILKVVKANLCRPPAALYYSIEEVEAGVPRVVWLNK